MTYRIAEHNPIYECGWIFISNELVGEKAVVEKIIEIRKYNTKVLEVVTISQLPLKNRLHQLLKNKVLLKKIKP